MTPLLFLSSIFTVTPSWGNIMSDIGRMFFGGNYTNSTGVTVPVEGIFGPLGGAAIGGIIAGLIILMFFLIITAVYGIGILIGSAILLPALFAVFQFIPPLRIIVAIFAGLLFGLGLHKFVRR